MRGQHATRKIQTNNYHHGSCDSSLTGKTLSVSLIFTHRLAFFQEFFSGEGGQNLLLCKFLLLCYCCRAKFQEGAKVSRGGGGGCGRKPVGMSKIAAGETAFSLRSAQPRHGSLSQEAVLYFFNHYIIICLPSAQCDGGTAADLPL